MTQGLDQAIEAAEKALDEFIAAGVERGLLPYWGQLVRDVYSTNIARFEPDELGDTANSLGSQCSENLKVRAVRRFRHEDSEDPEDRWDVPGLIVGTPRNSLTFSFNDARVTVMKVAYSEGRNPAWDRLVNWDYNSQVRQDLAAANSRALNYRTYASIDVPMFDYDSLPGSSSAPVVR